jgi:hypothetical protein
MQTWKQKGKDRTAYHVVVSKCVRDCQRLWVGVMEMNLIAMESIKWNVGCADMIPNYVGEDV